MKMPVPLCTSMSPTLLLCKQIHTTDAKMVCTMICITTLRRVLTAAFWMYAIQPHVKAACTMCSAHHVYVQLTKPMYYTSGV